MITVLLATVAGAASMVDLWVDAPAPADRLLLHELGFGFVEERAGSWYRVHGDEAAVDDLDRAGLAWRRAAAPAPVHFAPAGAAATEGYLSPAAMSEAIAALAEDSAGLATLVDVGESEDGRRIRGLALTAAAEPRARWRILGAHHGDELASAQLALAVAQALVDRYGEDPTVTALLDQDEVWVVPHVNPDGVALESRYNSRDVDINRNYAYQWSESEWASGDAPFSESETRGIRTLSDWTGFGAGLSLHAGETNLGWVWNYTVDPSPDAELLEAMALRYATACTAPGFWVTNGASWYLTRGDTNDWSYGRHGALDFTLEVSDVKTPDPADLPAVIDGHLDAVLGFLTWPDLASGEVVDATTGRPLQATITLVEGGQPFVTGPDGRFSRPVPTGTWTVEVAADGYASAWTTVSSAEEPTRVALDPDRLLALRPEPTLLSRSGDGTFDLDTDTGSVVLLRPGEEPVVARAAGGSWQVDLDALSPGPWSLETDDGVAPRALWVGETDDSAEIAGVEEEGNTLALAGKGFEIGSRAWAFWGTDRAAVAVPVLEEDEGRLLLDSSALADAPRPVDLLVLTGGRQLAVLDALDDPAVDTAEPVDTGTAAADTGQEPQDESSDPRWGELSATGCSAAPGYPGPAALVTLAVVLARTRRKTCVPRRSSPSAPSGSVDFSV